MEQQQQTKQGLTLQLQNTYRRYWRRLR